MHPDTLANRTIHPYGDFLLHDVGTGDGIPIALVEHFGRERVEKRMRELEGSRATEAKQRRKGKTEDECSESYQTAVLEGEKSIPICCGILCARATSSGLHPSGAFEYARLMHDGASVEVGDAVRRHKGEAEEVTERFSKLSPADRKALLAFLQSL